MDKAEKDALEIVDCVRSTLKYPTDRTLEIGIARALRARDEEIAKQQAQFTDYVRRVNEDLDQLRAERDAAVAALKTISALKTQTLLCDPGDYDFNAEDAYQGGAHKAFCQAAEEADAALAQLPHAAERARLVDAVDAVVAVAQRCREFVPQLNIACARLDAHEQGAGSGDVNPYEWAARYLIQKYNRGQRTYCYCPGCGLELCNSKSWFSDSDLARYQCIQCGTQSAWLFDAPVPILIKNVPKSTPPEEPRR